MVFDPRRAHEFLMERARQPVMTHGPAGAPLREYTRSPAAERVAELAFESGLYLFHYEYCGVRELPEDWLPPERSDLAMPPRWENGVLSEPKYHSFRHDQPVGGFHPGHRAKWSTHELCHSLVGYAWNPQASPFFHATASRLAELLPVTLWYFLDEVAQQRCPMHESEGALFRAFCPACDAVAAKKSEDPEALNRLIDGAKFLDLELAAIHRSRQNGRPISNLWATVDLASDGVAYAGAHGKRLNSEAFRHYAEQFIVWNGGACLSLEDLEARLVSVARAITEGEPLVPWAPSREHGETRWKLQDLGWRLLTIWHETSGEASEAILDAIELLAVAINQSDDPKYHGEQAIRNAAERYQSIEEEWIVPSLEEAFAVGYPLVDGLGYQTGQVSEGIRSALPLTVALLPKLREQVAEFVMEAPLSRQGLGERFAIWLKEREAIRIIPELARYEAAIAHAPLGDETVAALGIVSRNEQWRLAEGLKIYRFFGDIVEMAERVDTGEIRCEQGTWIGIPEEAPRAFVIGRVGGGDLIVLDVSEASATALEALGEGSPWTLDLGEGQSLRELGVLVPAAWAEVISLP